MKLNVLLNDTCRVMRNSSERLEWNDDKKENLEIYMRSMQISGYTKKEDLRHKRKPIGLLVMQK